LKKSKEHDELNRTITNILTPPTSVWGDDVVYRHSDTEDSESDFEFQLSRQKSPTPPARTNLAPLDPGIMRYQHVDHTSSVRSVLKFDPGCPRPAYALKPTFGNLPGLYVGKKWHTRLGAFWDGTHPVAMSGISGKFGLGAWSIALSGGYEDDFDEGFRFVYTGSGGREVRVLLSRAI
jgi:SAD/SRA domain